MSITARTAGTLLAAAALSAQAAPYVASFDPLFGSPFSTDPTVGWRGTTSFDVDDACLATPGTVITISAEAGCTASITSAAVEFYDFGQAGLACRRRTA